MKDNHSRALIQMAAGSRKTFRVLGLTGLRAVLSKLLKKCRSVCADAAGNNEGMAFVYEATRSTVGDEIGK